MGYLQHDAPVYNKMLNRYFLALESSTLWLDSKVLFVFST